MFESEGNGAFPLEDIALLHESAITIFKERRFIH
jgi:hypothetical protein